MSVRKVNPAHLDLEMIIVNFFIGAQTGMTGNLVKPDTKTMTMTHTRSLENVGKSGKMMVSGSQKMVNDLADVKAKPKALDDVNNQVGLDSQGKNDIKTSYGKSSEIITNKFPNEEIPTDGYKIDYYISYGKIKGINGRKGNFDFVITKDGQLLIGSKHHYLGNAEDVVAAGQIKINGQGVIKRIDNLSGHYRPTVAQAMNYQILFEQQGLALNKTWLEYYYIPIDSKGYCGDLVPEYIKMIEGE